MPVKDQSGLGCSKCRFSKRGCKRCKDPSFHHRDTCSCSKSRQAKRQKRQHSPAAAASALNEPTQVVQQDVKLAPQPADAQGGTAEAASSGCNLSAPAPEPLKPFQQEPLKAPPPDSSSAAPVDHNPIHAQSAVTYTQAACHQETSSDAAGAAAASSPPTAVTHNNGHFLSTSAMVDDANGQHSATSEAAAADHVAEPSSAVPAPSPQDTASGARSSFLLMLRSKMDQRRQQRRDSQSASDSSLSSLRTTTVGSADKAEASVNSGCQAPEAVTAPRHKVKQQRRRSAKKPAKTRAFLQAGVNPRQALWHPPASPYGLIEEMLYEDPWKLLVACMLLNVTSGLQVRKVIWRLFAIWPTAEAAAGASDDTLVIVEKLIQPLGLFRKRTMAIKKFSQQYLTIEWLDPIELHGIGQYASDAYFMFCRGNWQDVQPTDKDLLKYQHWLHSTGGEGTGLERDVMPDG
ncbi:hypothetical protein ABBQ32_009581 [Trebouxia sp. C0010 RCD-2024]